MEEKILSPAAAWSDFYSAFKGSELWHSLTEPERQYLRKTNRQISECGVARVRAAMDKYAPGAYEYVGGFTKK